MSLSTFRFNIEDKVRLCTSIQNGDSGHTLAAEGAIGHIQALTLDARGTYASVKFLNGYRGSVSESQLTLA